MTKTKPAKAPAAPVSKGGKAKAVEPAPPPAFEVQLSCPHCGGPVVVTDATVSHQCEHCRSLLLIEAPEREEVFVEPPQLTDPAAILESLVRFRVDAQHAALIAKHTDEEGRRAPEIFINALLKRFESRLRESARIIDCRLVHVPYRHTAGKVVQAVLGRHGDGPKIARLRAYVAEQTTPAYDPARFNLRDVGLRLGRSVFKPLLSADVPQLGRFVPRAEANTSRRELEKWCGQNLEAGFEPVTRQGRVSVNFEATVYRPYYLVRASLDRGDETLLVDGGFGTIAGYLSEAEREAFARGKDKDPLGTQGPSFRRVTIAPARCPNCGMDPGLSDEAILSVCRNCHAGVAPSPGGLILANYDREEGTTTRPDTVLLPFWRFPFDVVIAGLPPIRTLEAYAAALFPQALPAGFAPRGNSIYVPAWRLLTTESGDETFAELARAFHQAAWGWTSDRVGLEARPRFVPFSLAEDEARSFGWGTLFALHNKASAARLNTLLLKRTFFDAKMSFGKGTAALVAFSAKGKAFARPEVSIPQLLIDGGATLAAQRVTVQQASSAVSSEGRQSLASRLSSARTGGEGR